MNLILFSPEEAGQPLELSDDRAVHLQNILKINVGDSIDAGIEGRLKGRLTLNALTQTQMIFTGWDFADPAPAPYPVSLIIGTPRPPTARRLLKDLTALGAGELHFCSTDLGEKSYLQSTLWEKGEYHTHLREGAQQAETTHLPLIHRHTSLWKAIKALPPHLPLFAFDLDRPSLGSQLASFCAPGRHSYLEDPQNKSPLLALCLGPERGWSEREKEILESHGVFWVGLGPRILRTETACAAALSITLDHVFWGRTS